MTVYHLKKTITTNIVNNAAILGMPKGTAMYRSGEKELWNKEKRMSKYS